MVRIFQFSWKGRANELLCTSNIGSVTKEQYTLICTKKKLKLFWSIKLYLSQPVKSQNYSCLRRFMSPRNPFSIKMLNIICFSSDNLCSNLIYYFVYSCFLIYSRFSNYCKDRNFKCFAASSRRQSDFLRRFNWNTTFVFDMNEVPLSPGPLKLWTDCTVLTEWMLSFLVFKKYIPKLEPVVAGCRAKRSFCDIDFNRSTSKQRCHRESADESSRWAVTDLWCCMVVG